MCEYLQEGGWNVGRGGGAFLTQLHAGCSTGFTQHLAGMIPSGRGLITPASQMGKEKPRAEGHGVRRFEAGIGTESLPASPASVSSSRLRFLPWMLFGVDLEETRGQSVRWGSVPMGFCADINRPLVLCLSGLPQVYPSAIKVSAVSMAGQWAGRNRSD